MQPATLVVFALSEQPFRKESVHFNAKRLLGRLRHAVQMATLAKIYWPYPIVIASWIHHRLRVVSNSDIRSSDIRSRVCYVGSFAD
jgi:hypothetical protein